MMYKFPEWRYPHDFAGQRKEPPTWAKPWQMLIHRRFNAAYKAALAQRRVSGPRYNCEPFRRPW